MTEIESQIARHRFGLGPLPGERVLDAPREWLDTQLSRFQAAPPPIAASPGSAVIGEEVRSLLVERRMARRERRAQAAAAPARAGQPRAPNLAGQTARRHYVDAVGVRGAAALVSDTPFVERLVHFWANHFAVSADKVRVTGMAGAFEFEAIRPHVLGQFADMLQAVERHPAMLIYLDQAQSVGPASPAAAAAGERGRKRGLNENLAREIMELHTLGVRTGYAQSDVTELARALTGWTVGTPGLRASEPGAFFFAGRQHEPGARRIMGKTYPQAGEEQGTAALNDLARHSATARHVATKLARHFVGDTPPNAMVARMENAFSRSGGDLPTLYRALIASPKAWTPGPGKFKSPWDWTISALRASGVRDMPGQSLVGLQQQLGQPVWRPGSPAGYDDLDATWAAPDALMRRVEASERLAARAQVATIDARARAAELFPAGVNAATLQAIARAESPPQALALLLVSPPFLRR